jgi:hypothetical protein
VGSVPLLPALRKKSTRQFNFDKALPKNIFLHTKIDESVKSPNFKNSY